MDSLTADQLQALRIAFIAWGIGFLVALWNLLDSIAAARSERKPQRPEKRFIEPCATDLHIYDDDGDVCTTCKQPKEPLP